MDALAGQEDLNVWAPVASTKHDFPVMAAYYEVIVAALKFQRASDSLGGLLKIHITGPYFQNV